MKRPTFDKTGGQMSEPASTEPSDAERIRAGTLAEMRRRAREPIPPAPPGWNKTVADLLAESKGGVFYAHPEMDWARDYERSLIPAGTRFPRKGDVYEALSDMPVKYATDWRAPYTGGGDAMLLAGDRLRVYVETRDPEPLGAFLAAVDRDVMEARIVPASDREDEKYAGFHFVLGTVELNRMFRLVHEE